MKELYEKLTKLFNDYAVLINTTSYLMGLIGFIALFKKSKKKAIDITFKTRNIVHDSLINRDKIKVFFKDILIKQRLSLTRVAIFNSGKGTIEKSDIPRNDQLCISFSGQFDIYGVEISYSNNIAINSSVIKLDENRFQFDFDFLDEGDGFVIDVYHSEIYNFKCKFSGQIKGGRKKMYVPIWKYSHNTKPTEGLSITKRDVFLQILLFLILFTLYCFSRLEPYFRSFLNYYFIISLIIFSFYFYKFLQRGKIPQKLNNILISNDFQNAGKMLTYIKNEF